MCRLPICWHVSRMWSQLLFFNLVSATSFASGESVKSPHAELGNWARHSWKLHGGSRKAYMWCVRPIPTLSGALLHTPKRPSRTTLGACAVYTFPPVPLNCNASAADPSPRKLAGKHVRELEHSDRDSDSDLDRNAGSDFASDDGRTHNAAVVDECDPVPVCAALLHLVLLSRASGMSVYVG